MHSSLIITTYNRPDALQLVLQSVLTQTVLPYEIIVADDGSGPETREIIDTFKERTDIPVIHAWQDDHGFRAARARNLATSRSNCEYLIFIDGDMILHPRFISSHMSAAQTGYFLHGKRAMLSRHLTDKVLRTEQGTISPFALGITMRRYAIHSNQLARMFSYESKEWYKTQSANLSMWKQDFVEVNGFNEDFEGWGREDSELALRLMRYGLRKHELRFCAIAFHLAHGKDSKVKYVKSTERNQELLDRIVASDVVRCANGLNNHLSDASKKKAQ